jgi:hypothetical protein
MMATDRGRLSWGNRPSLRSHGTGGLTFACLPDPDGARWQQLPSYFRTGADYPGLHMPVLQTNDYVRATRPLIAATDVLARLVAVLVDLHGVSRYRVTRLLREPHETDDAARARIRRHLTSARTLYAERGILPWYCFEKNGVPAEWWRSDVFAAAVQEWRWQAFTAVPRRLDMATLRALNAIRLAPWRFPETA